MTTSISRRGFLGGAAAFFVAELPQGVDYTLEARAFNCFGKASRPLVSGVRRSVPGLAEAKR